MSTAVRTVFEQSLRQSNRFLASPANCRRSFVRGRSKTTQCWKRLRQNHSTPPAIETARAALPCAAKHFGQSSSTQVLRRVFQMRTTTGESCTRAELSEFVLARDWNSPEEDAAWSNL